MELLMTVMNSKRRVMSEGITHIEDLSPKDFISTVRGLDSKIIDEKLDGNNLWIGLDEQGVFTSREGKSSKAARFYSVKDYPVIANYNGFRAAHLAVMAVEDVIRKHLKFGDIIEVEVLFGRQTNTVTYGGNGLNYVCFLRGINGTEEKKLHAIEADLTGKKVTVKSMTVSSSDGTTLTKHIETQKWTFIKNKPLDLKSRDISNVDSILKDMEQYLQKKNENFPEYTNAEMEALSLNSVKKNDRDALKAERSAVSEYIMKTFKLKVKELLLTDIVRKIKPQLQDETVSDSEDTGVEGVVVRDPNNVDDQVKIVDKDVFTSINQFNSIFRAKIGGTVKTTDQDADIEKRGGLFGQARIEIASLFGARELATAQGAKKIFTRYEGKDQAETLANFAAGVGVDISIKDKIVAILDKCKADINEQLSEFKKNRDTYKITLKTGKVIGISDEVYKRALTACAETLEEIAEMRQSVNSASSVEALASAVFERPVSKLFKEHSMTSFLQSIITEEESGVVDVPATTSSAVASHEVRITGDRIVQKRKRTFKKKNKIVAPVAESLDNEGNDTAKDASSMSKQSSNSTRQKFAALQKVIGGEGEVRQSDVIDYLDTAHKINDEVDTVAFGMEDEDGNVIKVHVNAEQGDDFHKALADKLTNREDQSLEDVLNDLADDFDIVDVEWNYGNTNAADPDALPAEFEDDEESPEIDLSTATDEEKPKTVTQESSLSRLSNIINEGKKKSDELNDFTPEEIELLTHGGNSRSVSKLLKRFSDRGERGIIMLMIALGVPVTFIQQKVKVFREGIAPWAEVYVKDSVFRRLIKKFIQEVSSTSIKESAESIGNTFAGKYEHEVYNLLIKLGLPVDHLVTINKLINNISEVGNQIQQNGALRTCFKQIKTKVKSAASHLTESEGEQYIEIDEESEEYLTLAEATLSLDPAEAITSIFSSLGFDVGASRSISMQLKNPATYKKVRTLLQSSKGRHNLSLLVDIISNISESTVLEDLLSDWVIVTTDTVSLRNVDFSIKFNKVQSTDFKDALSKKKGFAAEVNDVLYVFEPSGTGYTVEATIDEVEKSGSLSSEDIETILES